MKSNYLFFLARAVKSVMLLLLAGAIASAAFGQSTQGGSTSGQQGQGPDDGRGGPPCGGGGSFALSGAYTVDGGDPKTESGKTYSSDAVAHFSAELLR